MTKPPQAHPHPPNDLIKKLGDRYEQFEFLAKGGMGAIFVSYDRVLGKQVAVKILTYKDINDKHLVRFQQEAITASKLTHPNIVNTLDFGITEANHPYLIMDFLPGVSLSDLLAKESSISLDKALTLTCQIGRAITFAHSKGVTHRDLKTSNIVVDCYPQAPEAKVIDFGLARLENQSDSTGKLTMVGSVVGSPLYMSPEQANGKLSDERSDIYSLGCILYAMIVGMAPFEGEDTLRIMQLKQHETPSLVNSLDSDFPDALVSVMAKVLAPHPADRYQTMAEFMEALEDLQKDGLLKPAPTQQKTPQKTPQKVPEKSKSTRTSVIALLIAIGLGTIALALLIPKEDSRAAINKPHPVAIQPKFKRLNAVSGESPELIVPDSVDSITDEDLADLPSFLKAGHGLSLEKCPITGAGLSYLTKLPISYLNLGSTKIKDENLIALKEIKGLKQLLLSDTLVTGAGLEHLKGLNLLNQLMLTDCQNVEDSDMSIIGDLPVAKLALEGTKITDAGLKALAKAKNLKELNLDKTRLTNTGLTYLKDLKLKRLELNNCQGLSGQALAIIANQWPDIEFIGISYVPFSSNDFQQLVKCKKLRYLLALNSKLNNDDLKLIGTFKNLKWLYLSHGKFDDQALTHLYNLKNLKVMSLHETPSVSPEAVKLLKSKLPSGCELMTDRAKGVGAIDDFSDMIQKSIDGHLEE